LFFRIILIEPFNILTTCSGEKNKMKKILITSMIATFLLFSSCKNNSGTLNTDDDMTDDNDDQSEIMDEIDDELSDEYHDDINGDDDEKEMIQTGGIVIFDDNVHSDPDEFKGQTILGQGGFFGYSLFHINDDLWAASAIHESIPPYDFEKAAGKLYIFEKNKVPSSIEDAVFTLTHPDLPYNTGFGFTFAGLCDINGDGIDDIVVSAHLANYGNLYAAGEIVVFYGSELGWDKENTSISRLSDTYIQKADSMSQSLVCGDIDGDGFADVMAGGQNAGPELTGGGSQGMVAFFKGSANGLEENESWVLLPEFEEKAQYFGSSMLLEDINGDEIKDLIVSGWGLKGSELAPSGGGVYIYHGGTNWQDGPSLTVFGPITSQFGSAIKLVAVEDKTLLGVIAPKASKNGIIYFYDPETLTELFAVSVPPSLGMGDNGSFTDFDTISDGDGKFTLVAGGKHFKDYGRILCANITTEAVGELVECPWQPETTTGGFGSSVRNIGKIDASNTAHLVVGMPEYIHTLE
jgi:hypothetical protein